MAGMPGAPSDLARLAALADQCVMCGLCLPFCPTYAVGREEGESPRGRIALIKAVVEGRTPATPTVVDHLDSCLACRRCEAVCPANVQYGELIAGARALPAISRQHPRWRRALDRSLTRPRRLRTLQALRPMLELLRPWLRRSGAWAKRIRLIATLPMPAPVDLAALASQQTIRGLPAVPIKVATQRQAVPAQPPASAHAESAVCAPVITDEAAVDNPTRQPIVLFQGCIASHYETRLRSGALRLLDALGERAVLAEAGLCCGSLARLAGDTDEADARETALAAALRTTPGVLVLGSATGCQSRLADVAATVGVAADELPTFLSNHPHLQALRFAPLDARVAVHRPCSQRALGQGSGAAVDRLLSLVPGLIRVDLPEQDRCCGAAGSHFIARPAQSLALRDRVLGDVVAASPDMIVSANIGCRLMIAGGLRAGARNMPVLHPVELLAQQLLP